MRRDMDLVRKMILALEEALPDREPELRFEGVPEEKIRYHLYLLYDAGLIRGELSQAMLDKFPEVYPLHLSWRGHDFADAVRSDTVWQRAKSAIGEKLSSVSFDVLLNLINKIAVKVLGVD